MKTALSVLALFVSASAFAADAKREDAKKAMEEAAGAASAPAETKAPEGLDVSKMAFSPVSIRTVVQHYQPQIQACYEDNLATRETPIEGKLMTSFVITPEGLVKNAKVQKKGPLGKETRLHDCVVAVLSAMTFPKPVDNRDHPIEYPFNLKAIR